MPTCVEKSCRQSRKQNCTPRHEKCCRGIIPYNNITEENERCDLGNCTSKINNSKPLNVRLKLQLVNDDKNRNARCLCAKYFEMLDACYGGLYPYGNFPKQGICPPQAPYSYDNRPTPFLIGSPPMVPEFSTNLPTLSQAGNINSNPGYVSTPSNIKISKQYKEMDTQTNDYNRSTGSLHACEDYVEKLLKDKEDHLTPAIDQNIQALAHIHRALAGITKTLQEIQIDLKERRNNNVNETHKRTSNSVSYSVPEVDSYDDEFYGDDLDKTVMHVTQPQIRLPGFWPILPKSMPPPPPPLLPSFRISSSDDLSWLKSLPDSIFNKEKFLEITKPTTLPSLIPRTVQSQLRSTLPPISETSPLLSNYENKSASNVLESVSLGEGVRLKNQNNRRLNRDNLYKHNINVKGALQKRKLQQRDSSSTKRKNENLQWEK